jgi:glutamine synthetase
VRRSRRSRPTWIDYKREKELKPLALRPHPFEFELYFGV